MTKPRVYYRAGYWWMDYPSGLTLMSVELRMLIGMAGKVGG